MVRMFMGVDVRYHYEVDGKERAANMFETVVRDAVESPESFGISMYLADYSEQKWTMLLQLCEKLNTCRSGERYSGAKLEQWISGRVEGIFKPKGLGMPFLYAEVITYK